MAALNLSDPNARVPTLAEVGVVGMRQFSGYVREELHKNLQGKQGALVYRQMSDNEAVIGAFVLLFEMLIRQVEWKITPAKFPQSGSPVLPPAEWEQKAQWVSDRVEECRLDMEITWSDFLSEVMSMVVFGWVLFEQVYKLRKGRNPDVAQLDSKHNDGWYGWRTLGIRAQDTLLRWQFDDEGRALGMWQQALPDYRLRYIPLKKAILFRTRSHKNNPEGRSMLRNAYRSWYFLTRMQEVEGIGTERDLAGLPVMQLPLDIMSSGATKEQKAVRAEYEDFIQKVRMDSLNGAVIPCEEDDKGKTGYKFGLLNAGGRRPADVNEIVKRYESRIAMSFLAQFLMLGQQGNSSTGSWALSSDHTDMFVLAMGSILENVCDIFNRKAIPDLCRLNAVPEEMYPCLEHGDIEVPDLTEISGYVSALSGAGFMVSDDETEDHLRNLAKLPKKRVALAQPAVVQPTTAQVQQYGSPPRSAESAQRSHW